MDWRSINFDWNKARAFLVTAEEGSLSAAARALGTTQSTLGRQVSALEEELGVSLFEKVGRGLEITPDGLALLEHVKHMAEAANQLSLIATGKSTSLEGSVAITAAEAAAVLLLPELVKKLHEKEPGISIEIISSNASTDLQRREADIAIRNFQPTHPELIARKLPTITASLYATPEYLKSIGNPEDPKDMRSAKFVGFADNAEYIQGLAQIGLEVSSEQFPYKTACHMTHWQLVKEGAAIGVMPDYLGKKEPLVQKVSDKLPSFPVESWLVVHKELRNNHRIQVVYAYLAEELIRLFENENT